MTQSDEIPGGYMFFDKKSRLGNGLVYRTGKSGYINDFDGGPEFIPDYTNDSSAFHFVHAFDLMEHLESEDFLQSKPKYQDQKEMLINQMDGLNENDN